ncbi:D-amino-acid dehydrogenase [Kineosphaera limosa]|uniref:Putative oxidoreductase n=1 Tax=Kineosphaera limosa NBRC 100340 TaxID=1184609 RepID=K6W578_9MICO|nr:FAD-dependent oxidoreductase [Kineosphaera limosa]NYE02864.1 D-amino-acid dehydrogenase [Kineosphaera limosa]GAB94295.1 putative oxidoreductase [Kineosphaera limosa NBRC 100340]
MSSTPENIVVVGAGMVGLSTAWFLQERGLNVTVVDRTGVAAGSSWGNAGWLSPALTLPLAEPAILKVGVREMVRPSSPVYVPPRIDPTLWRFLIGFTRHCTPRRWLRAMRVFNRANSLGLGAFDQLTDATGDAAVLEPTKPAEPFLAAFKTAADRQVLIDEFGHADGLVEYDLLEGSQVSDVEPAIDPSIRYGLRLHGQRFINPGRFVEALADAVRRRGGEIREGVTVRDVTQNGSTVRVDLEGGESLTADAVVLATGTWLGALAKRHGVHRIVQAGRGYSFTVHPEHVPKGPVYFASQRVACTPLGGPEDGLRVAGMMEFRSPEDPLDPRRVQAIIDAARPMLRGIDWDARHDEWVGSRPCTTDALPLVGRTRSDRVYVAGGHGMWGIALGPLTGRLIAEQIGGDPTDPLLWAFDPLR